MHTIERQLQQSLLAERFQILQDQNKMHAFCQLWGLHNDPVLKLLINKNFRCNFVRKLSFIPHINYLKAKCHKALQLLRDVAHTD